MRILRIKANGLSLYKDNSFDVCLCSSQRVEKSHRDAVYKLFGNIYINTGVSFIGINASGKTTALKVISFANYILNAMPLNTIYVPQILDVGKEAVFDIDFYCANKVYHLETTVIKQRNASGAFSVRIISEKLWEKAALSKINKSNLFKYDGLEPVRERNNSAEYLPDDVSIMIAVNKQSREWTLTVDLTVFTDYNLFLPEGGSVATEVISLLDSTIESLSVENINNTPVARLKYYGQNEIVLNNLTELIPYLSSGTIKGVRVFTDVIRVLESGGYLVVDEIENHFNRELVVSLLRLFMSKKTNPKGSVLIFSTHYHELLDEMGRNDSVFITRSKEGLTVDNLNTLLKRNDMKKSEVYQSNFLSGTAPSYKALLALQKKIIGVVGGVNGD